jgi:tRNA G18 (ribose-2'-O)-methylase SpoU
MREFDTFEQFYTAIPHSCQLIGVEMGGRSLGKFTHPERAIYLLGAEDNGLPQHVLTRCHHVVSLSSVRTESFNVAVAGSLVMFDRQTKLGAFGEAA